MMSIFLKTFIQFFKVLNTNLSDAKSASFFVFIDNNSKIYIFKVLNFLCISRNQPTDEIFKGKNFLK